MASLRWRGSMLSQASRSAIVLATFRKRSWARAERPRRVMAFSRSFSPSADIAQCLRIILGIIWAFAYVFFSVRKRSSGRGACRRARGYLRERPRRCEFASFRWLRRGHRREDRRNPLGEHRLARAGGPDEQDVVAPGAGDFERALRRLLAMHVTQVDGILGGFRKHLLGIYYDGLERLGRIHQIHGLRQRLKSKHVDTLDDGRFASVCFGHSQRLQAKFAGGQRCRKCAAHRSNTSIEDNSPRNLHWFSCF